MEKVEQEAKYDGMWVLRTNTRLSAKNVALKYKQLWMVEHAFQDMESVLDTRPVIHQRDETIRGHVFCSFLALALRKELYRATLEQKLGVLRIGSGGSNRAIPVSILRIYKALCCSL